jgi:hypothetical protein
MSAPTVSDSLAGVPAADLARWLTYAAAGMGDDALWERRYGSVIVSAHLSEQAKRAAQLAKALTTTEGVGR